jgi:ABC-2 type transport system ATP-binding protein
MSLEVRNLSKYYSNQLALNDVSFEVKKGEIIGLIGPNGAGKSTMMKIIMGYIPPDNGEVLINGLSVF